MDWDEAYKSENLIWGDDRSELAKIAASRFKRHAGTARITAYQNLLDIGCGYGRDSFYLADELGYEVVGIDTSETVIAIAEEAASATSGTARAVFRCQDFKDLHNSGFDVTFASNICHLLKPEDRTALEVFALFYQR
ncbi:MAG TPA: methyltransferase domain-containing protein [Candidatus Aquicultor sp.]|jgi:cyclopropane fatty-acyl-phospholipid synthase-like methyltransferase